MTPQHPHGPRAHEHDGPHEDERVVIRDKRRIDPESGALRDLPQPGSAAADPGNPANATQPVTIIDDGALTAAKAETAERTADLQRITAEYANYRKRSERDRQEAAAAARTALVADLATVLDDIDRAQAHGDLVGPFKAVTDRLIQTLDKLGLAAFGAEGDEFDPAEHEAVQFATAADVAHPTVTAVLRKGYRLGDRLVRPAVVAVTGPEHDAGTGAGSGQPGPSDGAAPAGPDSDEAASGDAASGDAASDGA